MFQNRLFFNGIVYQISGLSIPETAWLYGLKLVVYIFVLLHLLLITIWGHLMTLTYLREYLNLETQCKCVKHMTFLVPCLTQVWPITHLASHLTPRVTCWDFHTWGKLTDISHTLNRVPTSVHTLPSHEHLVNHCYHWVVIGEHRSDRRSFCVCTQPMWDGCIHKIIPAKMTLFSFINCPVGLVEYTESNNKW